MTKADDKILAEAKKRFKRCQDWEADARRRFIEDLRFANGDPDNGYQWPDNIRNARDLAGQPRLTINKTRQHNLQIINDARQNKASVNVRPIGAGASYEAAQVFEGVVRHIEYISNAQAAYDTATWNQVTGGIGWWRVLTDYAGDDTFDQEIYIRRVPDPLSVYLDPDIQQYDGSDARFGFVFRDMPKDAFEAKYGKDAADKAGAAPLDNAGDDGWVGEDHVRVAEYYRRVEKADRLIALETGDAVRASDIPADILAQVDANPANRSRDIVTHQVEWFLIAGNRVVDRRDWPGSYVPLVRVVGEETVIDGRLDRKGQTRCLKDAQRMYNYWNSEAATAVALQSKTPYVAPLAAIEGLEGYWETANTANHSVLPYKHRDDAGQPLAPPQRQQPPTMPDAYLRGMMQAAEDMRMASGQYQAVMGSPSNETSGVAINARQRQGDNATYHFVDHLAQAIRFTGKILIDLIPKVYDTPRVIRILAENGDEQEIHLDPNAPAALQEVQRKPAAPQGDDIAAEVVRIFNPNVGKYEVEADIGPAYATRRQEAWNAFTQIVAQDSSLLPVIGDLMFRAADFPMADDIAERLKNMVPPQALGGPPPEVGQLQAQLQQLHGVLTNALQELAEAKRQTDIRAYDAETKRMQALNGTMPPEVVAQLAAQLVMQAMQTPLQPDAEPTASTPTQLS